MKAKSRIYRKYTQELIQRVRVSSEDDSIEVIVRLRDTDGLERAGRYRSGGHHSTIASEQRYSQQLMADIVDFVHQLEEEGKQAKLLGTSWLTNSMLVIVSPPVLRKLAERDDVDLLDVNADMGRGRESMGPKAAG